ncbi:MAG: hypothetical protein QNK37_34770 [Acidobacteriota bacterium]|nr:hypothetical protein [Acidobacteriota bacterium]
MIPIPGMCSHPLIRDRPPEKGALHRTRGAPLMVELTTRWLTDGPAERLITSKRREIEWRRGLAHKIPAKHMPKNNPMGYQVWLELPGPRYTDAFVSEARERGVKVIGAGAFAVKRRNVPQAVRLSIGMPSREDLERGC